MHSRLSSVIVTTPQAVALSDALKCLSFTRTVALPVLGVIENMSGYVCPCCGEVSNIFSTGGGAAMAEREGLPFLGSLPVDTELVSLLDAAEPDSEGVADGGEGQGEGFTLLERYLKTPTWPLFKDIVDKAVANIPNTNQELMNTGGEPT